MVAEEAAVGGKRRRMGRSEYKMAATVNNSAFSLRVTAPKYEHEVFALCGEAADDGIGKSLPTAAGMRRCLMGTYRKRGVEQQHSLACPPPQTAAGRHRPAQIRFYFLENIHQ